MEASHSTPSPGAPRPAWRFGRVHFDEASFELRVDGLVVEVERKPLEVLRVLLEHSGKVVTKSQLVQLAWPGRVIGDAALAKAIARLREAIGDDDHQIVRTHHRYGYRLVADVVIDEGAPAPTSAAPQAPLAPLPAVPPVRGTDAEHRVLTMMFCDIVDSTSLAESLDPETFRGLLLDYQRSTAEIVKRYEGHVAQQFGDGMLFYFGYPLAHDDDAERAARCACELMSFSSQVRSYTRVSLRIGIHTGAIVIGQSGPSAEIQATGAALHVAARLQALAEADCILITEATFRLVPGLFVTRDFGPVTLRGLAEPIHVHQVLQPSGVRSRLDTQDKLSPFVGRDEEIRSAEAAWRDAMEGRGRALVFVGEPGIGKSRLLLELRCRLAGVAHTWLEARGDALNRHGTFGVASEVLMRSLAVQESDSPSQRLQATERRLDELDLDRLGSIPLLAPLLGFPVSAPYAPSALSPEQRRSRTLELFSDWIARQAQAQPLVLAIEDLHWCDDSTIEAVTGLLNRAVGLPLLVVATTRPEYVPHWPDALRPQVHRLAPLGRVEVERMVECLADDPARHGELAQRVFERSGGVPLFVEELARAMSEAGYTSPDSIPGGLNSLLRARLDRTGAARGLLQAAAVIGMECGHQLLQRVSGLDDTDLASRMAQLIDAGMLHARDSAPGVHYVFKHALIRESAYGALLKSTRQELHSRAADAIEQLFPERAQSEPQLLAQHFETALRLDAAIHYYKLAADKARSCASMRESIAHCQRALNLVAQLPEDMNRNRLELDLSIALGTCATVTFGMGHPETERVLSRCQALCGVTDDQELRGRALGNLWFVRYGRAQFADALRICEQMTSLGHDTGDEAMYCTGLVERAWTLMHLGRLTEGMTSCEQACALVSPGINESVLRRFGRDAYGIGLGGSAQLWWLLGSPDKALGTVRQMMEKSTMTRHPVARAWPLIFVMAVVALFRREPVRIVDALPSAIEAAKDNGFLEWHARGQLYLGLAHCMFDRFDVGLPLARTANLTLMQQQTMFHRSMHAALIAEQCLRAGHLDEARTTLDEGNAFAEHTQERFMSSELERLRGELHRRRGAMNVAQRCLAAALDIARAQQATSLELRAATSLARLKAQQGSKIEARASLAPVYARFTEGFDTPDLIDAKTLLAEIA